METVRSYHDWKTLPSVIGFLDVKAILRFWGKTVLLESGCIEWAANKDYKGYGRFSLGGKTVFAHQVSWYLKNGLMLPGLVIDHLCKNRSCCNIEHLEAVNQSENVSRGHLIEIVRARGKASRKTHCKSGHLLSGDNYVMYGDKLRCRECNRISSRVYGRERKTK